MEHLKAQLQQAAEHLFTNAEILADSGQVAAADCARALADTVKATLGTTIESTRQRQFQLLLAARLLAPRGGYGLADTVIRTGYCSAGMHAASEEWTSLADELRKSQFPADFTSTPLQLPPWEVVAQRGDSGIFGIVNADTTDEEPLALVSNRADAMTIIRTRTLFGELAHELKSCADLIEGMGMEVSSARALLHSSDVVIMVDTLTKAGINILQSQYKGWYFEDDDYASEDFVSQKEVLLKAYEYLQTRPQTAPSLSAEEAGADSPAN